MTIERTNKYFKNRLFKFIFGNPEKKEWRLELYNALRGSNYDNLDDIKYSIFDEAICVYMKNDVSFIIGNDTGLYDRKATYSPNIPLMFLKYMSKLFESYLKRDDIDLESSDIQKIPMPLSVCFYYGMDEKEDKKIAKLSDMYYEDPNDTDNKKHHNVDLEVSMLNISCGHNKNLLDKCRPLYEYSFFVDRIRFCIESLEQERDIYTVEDAIYKAIAQLPKDFKIKELILENRDEVVDICSFEYDAERRMKDSLEEGIEIGREENMLKLLEKGLIEQKVVLEELGITIRDLERMKKDYKKMM